ncbi:hypothetical protein H2O64_08030 [Kordia sp. YSTF-M3]|uniref:Lipocalin-like domain-containing protein n=1 Tax=Kordia aestuariivivens TaxID=2759037 RepID=A0ABR7Q7U1_9FLAO|nr:hypothetical protein [Kordia aestuariivivens]MBC8754619.1 hypothetical protein [Kordia aestuariivivens]
MKKLVLVLLMLTTFVSCTSDDNSVTPDEETVEQTTEPITPPTEPVEPAQENLMLGEWKLVYIYTPFSANQITDYSMQNITYEFRDDGFVVVSADNLIHDTGEYPYTFTLESLGGTPNNEPLSLITTIEGNRFLYQERSDGLTRLSLSYIDGQDLFLEPL